MRAVSDNHLMSTQPLQQNAPALTERLAELQSWRYGLLDLITATEARLAERELTPTMASQKFASLRSQINAERLRVVVLGDRARGKSTLINALFFPDQTADILPLSNARAHDITVELSFDATLPISVRARPAGTSPDDASAWQVMPIHLERPLALTEVLATLPAPAGAAAHWAYVVINWPHPLLEGGLVVVESAGIGSAGEDKVTPSAIAADALLMVLDIAAPLSPTERIGWAKFFGASAIGGHHPGAPARLAVLNKIDTLSADTPTATALADPIHAPMRALDRSTRAIADALDADPTRVIAVAASLGLNTRDEHSADSIIRSRLYILERTLAKAMPRARQAALTKSVTDALAEVVEEAQQALDEARFDTLGKLKNLGELRAKNEKLTALVRAQASAKRERFSAFARDVQGVKSLHVRLGVELDVLADAGAARSEMELTMRAISQCKSAREAMEITRQYLDNAHQCIEAIDAKIEEARALFTEVGVHLNREFPHAHYEVHPFPTQRFTKELHKTRMEAVNEMLNPIALRAWKAANNAEQFGTAVGKRVVHIFEIARRESSVWLRGLYVALEAPLRVEQTDSSVSVTSLEKVNSAELDLAERIAELQGEQDVIKHKHTALAALRAQLLRFTGTAEDDSPDAGVDIAL